MPGFLADCLSRPENSDYVLAVETAKEWGIRPMEVLIPTHTRDRYTDLDPDAIANADLALMKAYVILKRESCSKCGIPYWIGHNTDNYIQFKVEESRCYSCGSLDQHSKNNKDNGMEVNPYPVLDMIGNKERPSRAAWLKSLMVSDD